MRQKQTLPSLRRSHTFFYVALSALVFGGDSLWCNGALWRRFPSGLVGGIYIASIGNLLWEYFFEIKHLRWYPFIHEVIFLFVFLVLPGII